MMRLPIKFGGILLPNEEIELNKWAAVACDQFTSSPKYWNELEELIKNSPSTFHLIFPEIYLACDPEKRIEDIVRHMKEYLKNGIFKKEEYAAIVLERKTAYGNARKGLVLSVDLESYSYDFNDLKPIRATEGTVKERIPPRVKIRQNCPIELPHIMLLIDDKDDTLIGSQWKKAKEKLYDFKLNMNGGSLEGFACSDTKGIESALQELYEKSVEKYGSPFLFAVGDGNHSLATAKQCYLNDTQNMSRYALTEIVNIYDPGLKFEPIHRLVKAENNQDFVSFIKDRTALFPKKSRLFAGGQRETYHLPENAIDGVKLVQTLIDEYSREYKAEVDYIHGIKELENASENGVGLELFGMEKSGLFEYVATFGALPKKTFSMGEGEEKRYYLEARKINKSF